MAVPHHYLLHVQVKGEKEFLDCGRWLRHGVVWACDVLCNTCRRWLRYCRLFGRPGASILLQVVSSFFVQDKVFGGSCERIGRLRHCLDPVKCTLPSCFIKSCPNLYLYRNLDQPWALFQMDVWCIGMPKVRKQSPNVETRIYKTCHVRSVHLVMSTGQSMPWRSILCLWSIFVEATRAKEPGWKITFAPATVA